MGLGGVEAGVRRGFLRKVTPDLHFERRVGEHQQIACGAGGTVTEKSR